VIPALGGEGHVMCSRRRKLQINYPRGRGFGLRVRTEVGGSGCSCSLPPVAHTHTTFLLPVFCGSSIFSSTLFSNNLHISNFEFHVSQRCSWLRIGRAPSGQWLLQSVFLKLKVEVQVILRPTVSLPVLGSVTHLGPATNFSPSLFNYF
jgi:hypothetical protein